MGEILSPSIDVRTGWYEGPLSSLVKLVKKGKMSIWDVRVSEIVESFLSLIDVMSELNLRIFEDFIEMVSYLIVLKSRMLLFRDDEIEEENEEVEIERMEVRKLCSVLDGLPLLNRDTFLRKERPKDQKDLDPMLLIEAFLNLTRANKEEALVIEALKPSLEEKIGEIEKRLYDKGIYILDANGDGNLREKLVAILSVLELAKRKFATISQYRPFGRIIVKRRV